MRSLPVLLVLSLALTGCVIEQPALSPVLMANPNPPVPPPRFEPIPKPPPTEELLVWRPGDWQWAGNGYVWRPGEYERLDGHGSQYLAGHWAAHGTASGGAWVWEPGHWL